MCRYSLSVLWLSGTFCLDFGLETKEGEGDAVSARIFGLVDEAVCALQELGGGGCGCLRQSARRRTLGENHFPGEI